MNYYDTPYNVTVLILVLFPPHSYVNTLALILKQPKCSALMWAWKHKMTGTEEGGWKTEVEQEREP
jgi:hypothetical protein